MRERERVSPGCPVLGGGGGEGVCRVEGAKRWLTFQTKNSPSPTKIGILRLPQPCNRNETLGLPRLQVHAPSSFGMLALPYLKARIKNFKANGGEIQDQKYARDVRCQK